MAGAHCRCAGSRPQAVDRPQHLIGLFGLRFHVGADILPRQSKRQVGMSLGCCRQLGKQPLGGADTGFQEESLKLIDDVC